MPYSTDYSAYNERFLRLFLAAKKKDIKIVPPPGIAKSSLKAQLRAFKTAARNSGLPSVQAAVEGVQIADKKGYLLLRGSDWWMGEDIEEQIRAAGLDPEPVDPLPVKLPSRPDPLRPDPLEDDEHTEVIRDLYGTQGDDGQ